MHTLSKKYPRYGYRRIHWELCREGFQVNRKRVQRLWRLEGLKVPQKQRKRRRLASSDGSSTRRQAERPDHVWSMDFVHDQTDDGRALKILPILDEYTREWLTTRVARSITAKGVIDALTELIARRGAPDHIRCDNGPEFIANALKAWLAKANVETLYIDPGSPWQNPYSESFNSRLRDEVLDRELFDSLTEVTVVLDDHRHHYNRRRPHSSLGYLTPEAFAENCSPSSSGAPPLRSLATVPTSQPTLIEVGT